MEIPYRWIAPKTITHLKPTSLVFLGLQLKLAPLFHTQSGHYRIPAQCWSSETSPPRTCMQNQIDINHLVGWRQHYRHDVTLISSLVPPPPPPPRGTHSNLSGRPIPTRKSTAWFDSDVWTWCTINGQQWPILFQENIASRNEVMAWEINSGSG